MNRYLNPLLWIRRRKLVALVVKQACKRAIYRLGIVPDVNGRRIRALKDIHRGKRAFIIGNGPSLQVGDLDRLKQEITFGSNKVYLAFDQTDWRPTYYSVCDELVARNNCKVINELKLTKLLSDQLMSYFPNNNEIVWLQESSRNRPIQKCMDEGRPVPKGYFSNNALLGVDGGWTVIFVQLQLAYYMGITEVVLIGVDFSFFVPEKRAKTDICGYENSIESVGEVNHFHPDYRKAGEAWGVPRMDCQRAAFSIAREHFEKAGRKIINASRSTKLDVLERSDLESLLNRDGVSPLTDKMPFEAPQKQKQT